MNIHRLAAGCLALALAGRLAAHDMWIEPSTFFPENGENVAVRLRVGQDMLGDPLPRDSSLINQFFVQNAAGKKPLAGREGRDPAGVLRGGEPGLLVLGYRSNRSNTEQTVEKFSRYLKEEGLDAVAAQMARRKPGADMVRELYSRCAKSLLQTGTPKAGEADSALGFTLELVAERDPYLLHAGDMLPIRLTYEGKPLAGALVVAMNRMNPMQKLTARTDKAGRVRFRMNGDGMWLIKAVHMVPAPAESKADWESFWASLTFEQSALVSEQR